MIEVIKISEDHKWDEIVKSFKYHDVYYLSGYVKGFQIHGDGEPLLIYYSSKDTRAINVVMKRDIAFDLKFIGKIEKNTFYDFATPYGYGGFLVEGNISVESIKNLDIEYCEYARSVKVVAEFVRFHPILRNYLYLHSIYTVKELGKTISVPLRNIDDIWFKYKGKNRNVIRKAKNKGIEILKVLDEQIISNFIPMYLKTMQKDEASNYYLFSSDFFESILSDLKENAIVYYAKYDEKIISMAIVLFENKYVHYHLSASNRDYQSLSATNLLLHEVIKWSSENGYETFHLGGGIGNREDNLYHFKEAFNPQSDTKFAVGKKIIDQSNYEILKKIREEEDNFDLESDFFPIYRS